MIITSHTVGPFRENSYLLVDETSGLYGRPDTGGSLLLGLPSDRWDIGPDQVRPDPDLAARVLTPAGERTWTVAELQFPYRQSRLQQESGIVLDAELELRDADPRECLGRLDAWLGTRSDTQPLGPPSSGCVFRNPAGDHAGRLIDASGGKGMQVGGATVSDRHANYILNTGGATAVDVLRLIAQVRAQVRDRSGVDLEAEIKLIGEFGPSD